MLNIVIVSISLLIIIFTAFVRPYHPTVNVMISILAFIVFMYFLLQIKPSKEQFAEQFTAGTIYNENVATISNGLVLYTSAFSNNSYSGTGREWTNLIVPTKTNTCTTTLPNLNFTQVPSFTKLNGFYLGPNAIIGPMSFQMGFVANESFTICFTIKFDAFSKTAPTKDIEILKLYGNTMNNNGISLFMKPDYVMENEIIKASMVLGFGDLLFDLKINSINTTYTYIFFIVKNALKLSVYAFPNVAEISSTSSLKLTLLNTDIDSSTDVLLSNKEMMINRNQNLMAHIYNFGVFNKALMEFNINDVYVHIQKEIQKNNQMLIDFNKKLADLQAVIDKSKQCPYDQTVCDACVAVTDWTDMTNVLFNASNECLDKINKFCIANPTHNKCTCWNPANIMSKTEACKTYKAIFEPAKPPVAPVPAKCDVAEIKKQYNLCPCAPEKDNQQNQICDFNKTDLEYYNEIDIEKKSI
jgi:hypothetical protein